MNEDTNIMTLGVGEILHHKLVLFQYHWDAIIGHYEVHFVFYQILCFPFNFLDHLMVSYNFNNQKHN